ILSEAVCPASNLPFESGPRALTLFQSRSQENKNVQASHPNSLHSFARVVDGLRGVRADQLVRESEQLATSRARERKRSRPRWITGSGAPHPDRGGQAFHSGWQDVGGW